MKVNLIITLSLLFTSSAYSQMDGPYYKKDPFIKKGEAYGFYGRSNNGMANGSLNGLYVEDFGTSFIKDQSLSMGCEKRPMAPFSKEFNQNIKYFSTAMTKMQCDGLGALKEDEGLSETVCLNMAGCLKGKINFSSKEAIELFNRAREQAAREAIALTARAGIAQMIDYESLKDYALKKYGKDFMPDSCAEVDITTVPRDENNETLCRTHVIDEGYELAQSTCRIPDRGCNFEYLDYFKEKRKSGHKGSILSSYITEKGKKNADDGMSLDTSILQGVAMIMADSSLPPTKRAESVIQFLYDNYDKLDPVLKNYYNKSFNNKILDKEDPILNGLKDYISLNEKKSSVSILADLENLRKSEAKSMLESQCKTTNTIAGFCGNIHDIITGADVIVEKKEFDHLISRGPKLKESASDIETLANNVGRCNTFNLKIGMINGLGKKEVKLSQGLDLFSDGDGYSSHSVSSLAKGGLLKKQIIIGADGSMKKSDSVLSLTMEKIAEDREKEKGSDLVLVRSFSRNASMPEVFKKGTDGENGVAHRATSQGELAEERPLTVHAKENGSFKTAGDGSFSSLQKNQFATAPIKAAAVPQNVGVISNDPNAFMANAKNDDHEKSSGGSKTSQYNQMVGKISELEDRLARAQKRLSDSGKSEEVKKSPSSDSESESVLIKELKNARNALAEMNSKKVAEAASTQAQKAIVRNDVPEELGEDSGDYSREGGRSPSGASSSSARISSNGSSRSSGGGRESSNSERNESDGDFSSSSRSIASSMSDEGGAGERDRSNTIVLTKVDGASGANVNQTIRDLIYAEFGKPFYIEENGFVKQIIPVMVDGKIQLNEDGTPVYKTVVKGKVGEFKVDLKGKKDQKMAKQESAADVKKSDDRPTQAVRYRELKDILNRTTNTTN